MSETEKKLKTEPDSGEAPVLKKEAADHWSARFTAASIDLQGKVKKSEAAYKHKYMPLEALLREARPAFKKEGLAFTQTAETNARGVTIIQTMLIDMRSGRPVLQSNLQLPAPTAREQNDYEAVAGGLTIVRMETVEDSGKIKRTVVSGDKNIHHILGGAITYFRRYALCTLLGVQPEGEDDDAGARPAKRSYSGGGGGFQKKSRYGGGDFAQKQKRERWGAPTSVPAQAPPPWDEEP